MSFGKGYARYKEIGRQNDRALDCLGQMLQPEQGAEGIERLFLQAVQATKAMIRSYCRTRRRDCRICPRAGSSSVAGQQGSPLCRAMQRHYS